MSEKMGVPEDGMTEEEREMAEFMLARIVPPVEIPAEEKKDHTEISQGLADELTYCEQNLNLDELYQIVDLTHAEAEKLPERQRARLRLRPIEALLKLLREETNIPQDVHESLQKRYKYISHAIGVINNGKVDHTR